MYQLVVLPDPIRPVVQAHETSITFGGHCHDYHTTDIAHQNLKTQLRVQVLVDEISHDLRYYNLLRLITIYYNLLPPTTTHYNLLQLQHTTTYYNLLRPITSYYDLLPLIRINLLHP